MSTKSRPTRQRPGAASGPAAAAKKSSGKSRSARSAENPFKKTAAGIQDTARAANANATRGFEKATDAASESVKSATRQTKAAGEQNAFQFGKQFSQATDWMRGQTESAQSLWQQALQSMPGMGTSAFGKQDGARNGAAYAANPIFANPLFPASMMGGSSAAPLNQASDQASRSMKEMASLGSDHMQRMSDCAAATAGVAKSMSQELMQTANSLFADQMELTKAALSCRNVDDLMELHGKASRLALDTMFGETLRLSEMAFKYAVDIAEPVQQSLASAGERMTKIVSKAAA